ncbi:hypothetical protein ABZP36_026208 [Zizania latifolia]
MLEFFLSDQCFFHALGGMFPCLLQVGFLAPFSFHLHHLFLILRCGSVDFVRDDDLLIWTGIETECSEGGYYIQQPRVLAGRYKDPRRITRAWKNPRRITKLGRMFGTKEYRK